MKFHKDFLKRLVSSVCIPALLMCMQIGVFADEPSYTVFSPGKGTAMTFDGADSSKLLILANPNEVTDSYGSSFYNAGTNSKGAYNKSGIAGKSADDYSAFMEWKNVPGNVSNSTNTFVISTSFSVASDMEDPRRTIEFAVCPMGNASLHQVLFRTKDSAGNQSYVQIYKFNPAAGTVDINGVKREYAHNNWNTIAMTLHSSGLVDYYFNGEKVSQSTPRANAYQWSWIQFATSFDGSGAADEMRSAATAIDDMYEYEGDYSQKIELPAQDSEDNILHLVPRLNKVILTQPMQYDDFITGMTPYFPDGTNIKVVDGTTDEIKTSGTVASGDFLKLNNADQRCNRYYAITDSTLVSRDDFSASSGSADYLQLLDQEFNNIDPSASTEEKPLYNLGSYSLSSVSGMFAKAGGDSSYGVYAQNVPNIDGKLNRPKDNYQTTLESTAPRMDLLGKTGHGLNNLITTNARSSEQNDFTISLKMAYTGDVDIAKLYGVAYVTEGKGHMSASRESLDDMFVIDAISGTASARGRVLDMKFYPDRWYSLAITFHTKACTYDVYVNGDLMMEAAPIISSEGCSMYGFNWLSAKASFKYRSELAADKLRNGGMYFDDAITYIGSYSDAYSASAKVTSEKYIIKNGYLFTDETDINTFAENINCDSEIVLYGDSTYSSEADSLAEGNVLVSTASDGTVIEYYTIAPVSQKIGSITGYQSESAVSASVEVYNPCYMDEIDGTLILAYYKDSKLESVKYTEEKISGRKILSVENVVPESGVTIKAFFVDSFGNMKPYTESIEIGN